jgi:hypothetical protein
LHCRADHGVNLVFVIEFRKFAFVLHGVFLFLASCEAVVWLAGCYALFELAILIYTLL